MTRERPKTDRIACPWLIRRFIDPDAEIIYVPNSDVLTVVFELAFPIVIAAAAASGYTASRVRPKLFTAKPPEASDDNPPPLIADDALQGERPSLARAVKVIAVGGILWATPIVAAGALFGRSHVFVGQGLFFSGTAVVTFGGAYAVLSFVAQRAVTLYHWLLPGEMATASRSPKRLLAR